MNENVIIDQLKKTKDEGGYTLHELSKKLDLQVTTIERWFKTKRINKIYAMYVAEKLKTF